MPVSGTKGKTMKIKQDYADPFWHREPTKFEKFINTKRGFILFIILLILAGAEIQ